MRAEATVTDYRVPFRALSNASDLDDSFDEGTNLAMRSTGKSGPPEISLCFSLADGKR